MKDIWCFFTFSGLGLILLDFDCFLPVGSVGKRLAWCLILREPVSAFNLSL